MDLNNRIDVQNHLGKRFAAGDSADHLWNWVFDRHFDMTLQDVGAASRFYDNAKQALYTLGCK